MPVAHGLGLGFDPPVITPRPADHRRRGDASKPGMVLAVTGYVWQQGVGAVFTRDAVLITADGAEVLTSSPFWRRRGEDGSHVRRRDRPAPEEIVLYEKDPETKIATITFNRPDYLNAPTIGSAGCATPTCCTARASTTT